MKSVRSVVLKALLDNDRWLSTQQVHAAAMYYSDAKEGPSYFSVSTELRRLLKEDAVDRRRDGQEVLWRRK